MDSWSTPPSKILTIINDDYMKMLEKEKESRLPKVHIAEHNLPNIKKESNLVKRIRNLVTKKDSLFNRVRFKPENPKGKNKSQLIRGKKPSDNLTIVDVQSKRKSSVISSREKQNLSKSKNNKDDKSTFSDQNSSKKDIQWWNPPDESMPIDFCRDTSLHGLKYIGQQDRHISERIFWLGAFLLGLIIAVILINDVWKKYNSNPIIVSFEPSQISVDRVPFPAITVCNMNKVLKSKAEEYIKLAEEATGDNLVDAKADLFYLDHVCTATKSFTGQFNFTTGMYGQKVRGLIQDVDASELTKVNEFLRKASQNCSDMIPLCIWQDQEYKNCSQLFRPIETEFGKCCTFNMIPQSELYKLRNDTRDDETEIKEWMEWNHDSESDADGVLMNGRGGNYPRRQMEAGKSYGLSFLLNPNLEEYFCTTSDSNGFRMQTHWPTDTPHVTDFGISIRTKAEVFVNVKPEITLVDPSVFKFDTQTRQCYRMGEYNLQYFKYYTISNCIDECISNETMKKCQCKRYYMPRSENQTLCGGNQQGIECAETVKLNMTRYGARSECQQCLSSCSEIEYVSQTTATPLQTGLWESENGVNDGYAVNGNVTILHVFIGQDATYAKVRKELFGTTDLFANTGGLMGLCLGFSGLSLMEVIYFLTLRAWWASKRKNEIRENITKKMKSAWRKVKTVRIFRNDQSVLDKQAEDQVLELEKVVGNSPYRLHMSPVYSNNNFSVQMENETEKVDLEQPRLRSGRQSDGESKPDAMMDYKNILGSL